MKTGLVLGGGGSRGAYQLGVWTALLELGEDYDLVCGTSIGAINGALFAQKSYGLAKELWNTITVADVMADGINFDLSAQAMLDQAKQIKPFLEKYVNHKGADHFTPGGAGEKVCQREGGAPVAGGFRRGYHVISVA